MVTVGSEIAGMLRTFRAAGVRDRIAGVTADRQREGEGEKEKEGTRDAEELFRGVRMEIVVAAGEVRAGEAAEGKKGRSEEGGWAAVPREQFLASVPGNVLLSGSHKKPFESWSDFLVDDVLSILRRRGEWMYGTQRCAWPQPAVLQADADADADAGWPAPPVRDRDVSSVCLSVCPRGRPTWAPRSQPVVKH